MEIIESLRFIILSPLVITSIVILFAFFYYLIVSSFLEDVVLQRLTKASFDQSVGDCFDLFFSYILGMVFYSYVIFFTNANINDTLIPVGNPNHNIAYIVPFGLGLLYTGRIITRKAGVFYGKLHFASIFLSAAFALGVDATRLLSQSDGPLFSTDLIDSIIVKHLTDFWSFLLGNDYQFIVWVAVGAFVLSTIGERFLARDMPVERSLLSVSHKFPSDIKFTTGSYNNESNVESKLFHGATDIEIRRMLNDDLVEIKCATKSLSYIKYIKNAAINHEKTRCQILRSPLSFVIRDRLNPKNYDRYSIRQFLQYSSLIIVAIFDLIQGRPIDLGFSRYDEKTKIIIKRNYFSDVRDYWIPLIKNGAEGRNHYFGELRFILTKNGSGQKRILFLVKDISPSKTRIGLYSAEPYITEHFEALFDRAWDSCESKQ